MPSPCRCPGGYLSTLSCSAPAHANPYDNAPCNLLTLALLRNQHCAGSQGIVYEGVWQGATVAVKWSIADELDAGAYELLFSRLLSHPNVVQTYDAKVAVLDKGVSGRTTVSVGSIRALLILIQLCIGHKEGTQLRCAVMCTVDMGAGPGSRCACARIR